MNQKQIALLILGGVLATTAFLSIKPAFYSNLNEGGTTELPGDWYPPSKGGKTRYKKTKLNRTQRKQI